MTFRQRGFALFLVAGSLSFAAPAVAASEPAQVTYDFAVSTRGINVGTAGYPAQFGSVTLACLERGVSAIVGRDARNVVIFENVLRAPPADDLAVRPYSRAFSEIQRVAWNLCAPSQPASAGGERTSVQKGSFARGGFTFPDEIRIQDQLGTIGCDASAADALNQAIPCRSRSLPQPFVSTLTRRTSR